VGPAGFEPTAFGFVVRSESLASSRTDSQPFGFFGSSATSASPPVGQIRPGSSPVFGTGSESRRAGPTLAIVDGERDNLLSVRQVHDRLAVSTATVYSLCEKGELAHVRVSNAIRVAPADLDRFIADRRRTGRTGGRGGRQ
jgi:excisionase family DNA binding protein